LEKIQDFPPSDNLRLLQLDVTDSQEAIQARIDEAVKFWGRIDVLVNNAGMSCEFTYHWRIC
jgi:NADP-dependent 3-hydroxy acid dehydrogenase YdfG